MIKIRFVPKGYAPSGSLDDIASSEVSVSPVLPHNFKELWVWQKSVALALDIYSITDACLPPQRCALSRRLRRAAVAVPARIARGVGIGRRGAYVSCLLNAHAAAMDVDAALRAARKFNLIPRDLSTRALITNDEIAKMLVSMTASPRLVDEPES